MTKTLSLTRGDKEAPDANNIRMNDLNAVWLVQTVQQLSPFLLSFQAHKLTPLHIRFSVYRSNPKGHKLRAEHAEILPLSYSTPFTLITHTLALRSHV